MDLWPNLYAAKIMSKGYLHGGLMIILSGQIDYSL